MYLVKVFDREMYPGMGDCYNRVWRDINAWGAHYAVHIHQDAGPPGSRGFTVIYNHSRAFAAVMDAALKEVLTHYGVPARKPTYRTNIAVLNNAKMPAVLVECGFYTSPADEAVGTEPYARAIALGIRRFVPEGSRVAIAASLQGFPEEYDSDNEDATRIARRAAQILTEEEKEVEDMGKIFVPVCLDNSGKPVASSIISGGLVYNIPTFKRDWWLDIAHENPPGVRATIFFHPQRKVNEHDYKVMDNVPVPYMNSNTPGLHICPGARWAELPEWLVVSVHTSAPVSVMVGP